MKNICRNILLLFLAATVFFVGAGVTIVNLCCSDCIDSLLLNGNTTSCHSPKPVVSEHEHTCCSNELETSHELYVLNSQHHHDCCGAERISVDIDHHVYKPDFGASFSYPIAIEIYHILFNTSELTSALAYSGYPDAVPISPPRDYLTLINVLII